MLHLTTSLISQLTGNYYPVATFDITALIIIFLAMITIGLLLIYSAVTGNTRSQRTNFLLGIGLIAAASFAEIVVMIAPEIL